MDKLPPGTGAPCSMVLRGHRWRLAMIGALAYELTAQGARQGDARPEGRACLAERADEISQDAYVGEGRDPQDPRGIRS